MAYATGWQYNPNQSATGALADQVQTGQNPNVRTDNGNASASSPFLSAKLQSGNGDGLTGGYSSWGVTAQNITNTDLQLANNQTALLAQKQAQDNLKAAQQKLDQQVKAAQRAGDAAQAKAYQQAQVAAQQANQTRLQYNSNTSSSYNGLGSSTGAVQGARGVSAEGQSQLSSARALGYNFSSANYDRTYHYNNSESALRNEAVGQAYSWLGTHYVLGGERNQVEVDCSGLVQAIYSRLGYRVPTHSAADQGQTGGRNNGNGIPGVRTSFYNLQPGDLVAWKDGSHIAIYAGNGQIIEASNPRVGTVRRALWTSPDNVVGIHLTFNDERSSRRAN